jgi:hypothetical protein
MVTMTEAAWLGRSGVRSPLTLVLTGLAGVEPLDGIFDCQDV